MSGKLYRVPKPGNCVDNLVKSMLMETEPEINRPILPEEITGTLGRILDEVELPADIHSEVEDLYQRAANEL